MVRSILCDDPPRPRRIDRAIPRDLESIVRTCIEKEPGHRYPGADDLAADLERFLAGQPLRRRRVGPLRRAWAWCRRHRARAAALGAGLIMAVALLGGVYRVQQLQAEQADGLAREGRFRVAMLELQQLRNGPRLAGWTDRAESLVREAVRLHGPGEEIQAEAVGLLQGLDARAGPAWSGAGGRFLAFDPAGTRLVVGGATDPRDRSQSRPSLLWTVGAPAPVSTAGTAAGPAGFLADGTPVALAVGRDGRCLELCDLRTGQPRRRLDLPGPLARDEFEEPPLALAMTPDGGHVAAACLDAEGNRVVVLWGDEPAPVRQVAFPARCLALAADGSLLAGGSEAGEVAVWSAATGEPIATLAGDRTRVHALALAAEPRRWRPNSPRPPGAGWLLAAGTAGGSAFVWDVGAHARLATCHGSGFEVMAVAFSPDSTLLATAGRLDGGVQVWEARTGVRLLGINAVGEFTTALAFTPVGRRLAAANVGAWGSTGAVGIWDLDEGRGLQALRGPESRIVQVAVSPDSRLVAGLANGWTVAIWDAASGRLLHLLEVPRGFSPDNAGLAFRADGRRFAFSAGREAVLWDLDSGREVAAWPLPPGLNDALAFHGPDQLRSLRTETADNVEPFGPNRPEEHPRVLRLRNLLGPDPLAPIGPAVALSWTAERAHATPDGHFFLVLAFGSPNQRPRQWLLDGSSGVVRQVRDDLPQVVALDSSGPRLAHEFEGGTALRGLPGFEILGRFPVPITALGPGAAFGLEQTPFVASKHRFGLIEMRRGERLGWIPAENRTWASGDELAIAPSGRFAVWGCRDGTVTLCEVDPVRRRMADYSEDTRRDVAHSGAGN